MTWKYDENQNKIFLDNKLDIVRDIQSNLNKSLFEKFYKKLVIVNPTKEKFEETLLKQYYYDLLRIYSNELEKENSVLFVLGFSFADEHIRDLTERVASSNPTLKVYIMSHGKPSSTFTKLADEAKNRNIEIIIPINDTKFNFENLNSEIFEKIISNQDNNIL